MRLDISTLAIVTCITFLTQVIALFIQYRVNRSGFGITWWLAGSIFWAVGVIFMPMVSIESLKIFAMVANPLVILGLTLLYIGITRFLKQRENRWVLGLIFGSYLVFYYLFMFVKNDISSRTIITTATTSILAFMSASQLFRNREKHIFISASFNTIIFFMFGLFTTIRFFIALFSPAVQTYSEMGGMLAISFLVPIIANLLWTFGFVIMVNQSLNAEIQAEKENLQLIFNTGPDAALISRLSDGKMVDVNSVYLEMSGYSREELIGKTTLEINIWNKKSDRDIFINALNENGYCENLEFVFRRKDGTSIIGRISAKIISIQNVPHIISVVQDITKSNQAAEALRESEELYRSILNASPDDITITDLQGNILVVSPAAKKIFGFDLDYEGFMGSHLLEYIIPEDRERARKNITYLFKGEPTGPNEYHGVRKDGTIFDIEVNSGLINDSKGQPVKMVFVVRDITERKLAEQQIQQLIKQLEIEKKTAEVSAKTDSLTGLANRRYFDEVLIKELARIKRRGAPLSLIMLDVDHFKKYNDTYGHLAGDECLRRVGLTLKSIVGRATDFVARYGGEEFVMVLTDTDASGAYTLAERIRLAIENLAIPHSSSDIAEILTVSLGVTTIFPGMQVKADQVVAMADEALYFAKRDGRNRTSVADKIEYAGKS